MGLCQSSQAMEPPNAIEEVAKFVDATLKWNVADISLISVKDISGCNAGKAYGVECEGTSPSKVVLKVYPADAEMMSPISAARFEAATDTVLENGIAPKPLTQGATWSIVKHCGGNVQGKAKIFYKDDLITSSELGELMAKVHAVPTAWFEPIRTKILERDPTMQELLAEAPLSSEVWNSFKWGTENGIVVIGVGHDPERAKKMMQEMLSTGVLKKFANCEAFKPQSDAGKRIVTCHGDFKPDNILKNEEGFTVIDYELLHVSAAATDMGMAFIFGVGPGMCGRPYEYRFDFCQSYLKASGLPSDEASVQALMLDAELASVFSLGAGLSNVYDAECPLLRGAPHTTAGGRCEASDSPSGLELIDLLADAFKEVRASKDVTMKVLEKGFMRAASEKEVGSEQLWSCVSQLKNKKMLMLHGLTPDPKL